MVTEQITLPLGQQVSLPGHFDVPVVLEAARPLGKGFECRVRLPDGTLDEAVLSAEEAAALVSALPALNVSSTSEYTESLFRSPAVARSYKERIDIAFDGYNDDPRELDEIEEVREYVRLLDQQFPFWLFFHSKQMLGLQCIVFCHLLPFLTDKGKAEHHSRQLGELLLKRWIPAMNQVVEFTGIGERELEAMTERFMMYVKVGPLKLT